jgi:exodeoxyribonuclease VII large subunit
MSSPAPNVAEYSVSELSGALKRSVEDQFGHVRVRGEISQFKRAASGHCYFRLKDENANLDAIVWKGVAGRLTIAPEDGLEVIATGKITTYAARSSYQIIVESMAPAGKGALMALLEERKRKLTQEGLFAKERKRAIPFLPEVIGIVTSPTGAVIRDILHRLSDRFPRHVLLWPVAVQGDHAAGQIASAIRGFHHLPQGVPTPDVIIVARGGGSLEDLWAFNEEEVVRAVADAAIPILSAVGHETDTTLIDYAADRRAPTPTAAAEMAVPVRDDLVYTVETIAARQVRALSRLLQERSDKLSGLSRGLPKPHDVLAQKEQRLDDVSARLGASARGRSDQLKAKFDGIAARLNPRVMTSKVDQLDARLGDLRGRHTRSLQGIVTIKDQQLAAFARQLRAQPLLRQVEDGSKNLENSARRLGKAAMDRVGQHAQTLQALERVLGTLSYQGTLKRGYALLKDGDGALVRSAAGVQPGDALHIELADGHIHASAMDRLVKESPAAAKKQPPKPKKVERKTPEQGSLF